MAISQPLPQFTLPISSPVREVYHHGWQSWSLAAWLPAGAAQPTPYPTLLQPMQYHPHSASMFGRIGHWLGAVRLQNGTIILLGGLGTDCTVEWTGTALVGRYHGTQRGGIRWFSMEAPETEAFTGYAKSFLAEMGAGFGTHTIIPPAQIPRAPLRLWCSWYSRYTHLSENLLRQDLAGLADMPFELFQIDDGWQQGIGDWVENDRFPTGLGDLAMRITASGRRAGLWLAPLIAADSSRLFREHPDWFVRDAAGKPISAGFNWGHPLHALDTTHPAAIEWLAAMLKRIEGLGFSYLKLDFLYAGALPGVRHLPLAGEEAYRYGLSQALAHLNPDTFILFCGAPVLASVGLCHGMRIGPDVASTWESPRDAELLFNPAIPGVRNALRTCSARLWQAPFYRLDPDVAYFATAHHSLTPRQARQLQDLCLATGILATSDLPTWLGPTERAELAAFYQSEPDADPTQPPAYSLPAEDAAMSTPPRGLRRLLREILGVIANQPATHRLLKWLDDRAHRSEK